MHGTVESAVLRLKVVSVNGSGDTHTAHGVDDDSWGENTMTWSNRPALGAPLASAAHGGVGDWVEFDVTDAVDTSDDLFSVALVADGSVLVGYGSRESISNAPQLAVQASWSYGAWSNLYQLSQGPDGDDDLDGVSNIDEYAFGGNPTNELDTGNALEFALTGDNAVLVHAERTAADSGLLYTVESTENLVSNIWAQVDPGPAVFSNGWKTVTHSFPTIGIDQQLFRLMVELQ